MDAARRPHHLSRDGGALEQRALRRALAAVILLAALGAGVFFGGRRSSDRATVDVDTAARAPKGVRIRVQVLNTTKTRGLARRATTFLRDRGYDVVETGTTGPERPTTLVLDRSVHPEWAARVARALGAKSESKPDSSRFVDVTVLLGGDWRPPAEPFSP